MFDLLCPCADEPDDDPPRRPARRKQCIRVGATLAPLAYSTRRLVYTAMNASRHRRGRLDDQRRQWVHAAVSLVAGMLEERQPGHPQVRILHAIRRRLECDLDGWEGADAA